MLTDATKTIIRCSRCTVERGTKKKRKGGDRLPPAWKRDDDEQPVCDKCWRTAYRLGVCIVPVAEAIGETKDAMWDAIRSCWNASTHAANLCVQTLAKADVIRSPEMEKLPTMPKTYLYGEIGTLTTCDKLTLTAVIHAAEARYRKSRFGVVWTRKERLPLYQYPAPYPLRTDNWRVEIDANGGAAILHCRFAGKWWALRLRGGHEFYRQRKQLESLAGMTKVHRVEASLYRSKSGTRIMAKLIGWFDREPQRNIRMGGEMAVTTGGGRFLCAVVRGRDPWILNEDRMRDKIQRHAYLNRRFSEDLKFEHRWPKSHREKMVADNQSRCQRQNDRLKTFSDQRAKMLAEFAHRCNVKSVLYDDTDESYFDSFPWFKFRERLKLLLEAKGIEFTHERSGDDKNTDTARTEQKESDDNE